MLHRAPLVIVCCLSLLSFGRTAEAVLTFDVDVTPNVIVGTGISNGGWSVSTDSGVEVGLRAKLRYDANGQPQNIFNYSGTVPVGVGNVPYGLYVFDAGAPAAFPNRALWNFEWSINTDVDGSTGWNVGDLTYFLRFDTVPQPTGSPLVFDPILASNNPNGWWDHSFGDNSTPQSGGAEATDAASYATLLANNNVAQQSWNEGFFPSSFNPNATGDYLISLSAFDPGFNFVGQAGIVVRVVPEATSFLMVGLVAAGSLLGYRRFAKR